MINTPLFTALLCSGVARNFNWENPRLPSPSLPPFVSPSLPFPPPFTPPLPFSVFSLSPPFPSVRRTLKIQLGRSGGALRALLGAVWGGAAAEIEFGAFLL